MPQKRLKLFSRLVMSIWFFWENIGTIPRTCFGAFSYQTEGPELYKKLREYDDANPNTSYLNKWWREAYLKDRRPVCINNNPQVTFMPDPNPEKMTQLQVCFTTPYYYLSFCLPTKTTCDICQRASAMITAAIRFMRTFESNRLSPDVYHVRPKPEWFDAAMLQIPPGYKSIDPTETVSLHTEVANRCGAFPLDMSQLKHMFRSKSVPAFRWALAVVSVVKTLFAWSQDNEEGSCKIHLCTHV